MADAAIPKHPYMASPILHLKGVPPTLADEELMRLFVECLRARPRIDRAHADQYGLLSGYVEFEKPQNAEKAYATLQGIFLPAHPYTLSLSLNPQLNYSDDPKPQAQPRLVKQLPVHITAGAVFEYFRGFGPIYRVAIQQDLGYSHTIAVIDFYAEEHAAAAQSAMHCAEIEGHTIAVQPYELSKGPIRGINNRSSWAEAPAFVPRSAAAATQPGIAQSMWAAAPARRPMSGGSVGSPAYAMPDPMSPMTYGGMPMVPVSVQPSPSTYIDPTNLFVKGLDPLITSQDLFTAFKGFGRIVSARVMRDEHTGLSKEFGFVSYTRAEDAAAAQQAMHGHALRGANGASQAITVRFHEPKKQRLSGYGGKRPYGMPREREGSFDSAANMTEDIVRRVSGVSPTGSPPIPSSPTSPIPALHSVVMRQASSSSSGSSTPAELPEKDRFLVAVRPLAANAREAEQLTDLLMSLSKKDRALCFFNPEHLALKVADARTVLAAVESPTQAYPTPRQTPETRSSSQFTPAEPAWTLSSIAGLPASQIIQLVHADPPPPMLANPDPNVVAETDRFMDGLDDKPEHEQKQKLGEKLFKVVKSLGFKQSPKITIYLLDNEDLRPLAHLMNEQVEVLKEKITQIQSQI